MRRLITITYNSRKLESRELTVNSKDYKKVVKEYARALTAANSEALKQINNIILRLNLSNTEYLHTQNYEKIRLYLIHFG